MELKSRVESGSSETAPLRTQTSPVTRARPLKNLVRKTVSESARLTLRKLKSRSRTISLTMSLQSRKLKLVNLEDWQRASAPPSRPPTRQLALKLMP